MMAVDYFLKIESTHDKFRERQHCGPFLDLTNSVESPASPPHKLYYSIATASKVESIS